MTEQMIERTFKRKRVFLPVIHTPFGVRGSLESIDIAVTAGADGVFLINQGLSAAAIALELVPAIKKIYPDLWIGINSLRMTPLETMQTFGKNANGIWTDDCGVDSLSELTANRAMLAFSLAVDAHDWSGLHFGGTAFKTQTEIPADRLLWVARKSAMFSDVVTTSGRATGSACDVAKVRTMRDAIGDHPMALASGITPENVGEYLPYVDAFLVASGIESEFGKLDPERTKMLAEKIHAFEVPA